LLELDEIEIDHDAPYKYVLLCDIMKLEKDNPCWIPAMRPKYLIEIDS